MKKTNKKNSLLVTGAMFAAAAVLLVTGTVGVARSAPRYESEVYSTQVEMYDIGVTLVEQSGSGAAKDVAYRDYTYTSLDSASGTSRDSSGGWSMGSTPLLEDLLGEGESLKLATPYNEVLSVRNTGSINEYVRVSVYKYWTTADGEKVDNSVQISPNTVPADLIDLNFVEGSWTIDTASSTTERTVLYYNGLLAPGESTPAFTDTLTIYMPQALANVTTTEAEDGKIVTTYDYGEYQFHIEARVDAIQDHNAHDAAMSVWGKDFLGLPND